jgi:hypothetical protein
MNKKEFKIPFIYKVYKADYGKSFVFAIRFLIFNFMFCNVGGFGLSNSLHYFTWTFEYWHHHYNWCVRFGIGINSSDYYKWQIKQNMKKMTPEQRKEICDIFKGILSEK